MSRKRTLCYDNCGKQIKETANYFASPKCQKNYFLQIKRPMTDGVGLPLLDIKNRKELIEKARYGDVESRQVLKEADGVMGLYNPKTKKMERW